MHKIKQVLFFLISFSMVALLPACGSSGDLYQAQESKADQNIQQKDSKKVSETTKKQQP